MARSESWVPSWDEPGAAKAAQPGSARNGDNAYYGAERYGSERHSSGRYSPDGYGSDGYSRGDASGSALEAGALVRVLRALSGSVAAGLVLLTLVAVVGGVIGAQRGFPGPGATSISVHTVGAIAALVCQRFADRRRNFVAVLASSAVFAIAAVVLWTQWWN